MSKQGRIEWKYEHRSAFLRKFPDHEHTFRIDLGRLFNPGLRLDKFQKIHRGGIV